MFLTEKLFSLNHESIDSNQTSLIEESETNQ